MLELTQLIEAKLFRKSTEFRPSFTIGTNQLSSNSTKADGHFGYYICLANSNTHTYTQAISPAKSLSGKTAKRPSEKRSFYLSEYNFPFFHCPFS